MICSSAEHAAQSCSYFEIPDNWNPSLLGNDSPSITELPRFELPRFKARTETQKELRGNVQVIAANSNDLTPTCIPKHETLSI